MNLVDRQAGLGCGRRARRRSERELEAHGCGSIEHRLRVGKDDGSRDGRGVVPVEGAWRRARCAVLRRIGRAGHRRLPAEQPEVQRERGEQGTCVCLIRVRLGPRVI